MSAYLVDKNHIVYLVSAAMSRRLNPHSGDFSWYHRQDASNGKRERLSCADFERAAEVGNMLWMENMKSISHRYPGESSATLPGPVGGSGVIEARDFNVCFEFNPVQVLQSIRCLDYQSCEHPTWEASESHSFLEALKCAAIAVLPGMEDAKWGSPEPRKGAISLSSLARKSR